MLFNSTQGQLAYPDATSSPNDFQGSVGLSDTANFFRRRGPLIGLVTGICIAIAAAFVTISVPEYTASAQILFNPQRDKAIGSEGSLSEGALDPAALDSQIALIKSRTLLQRVVQQQRLIEDSEFANGPSGALVGRARAVLGQTSVDQKHPDLLSTQAVEALRERVSVERVAKTYVATISVTSWDREKAMRLASAIANTYIADRLASRAAAGERSIRLINPPATPTSPSYPRATLTFALALLAGLIIGTGIAIAIEVMTVGFTTPRQIETALGVPVLGMLGKLTPTSAGRRKNRREEGRTSLSDGAGICIDHLDPLSKLLAQPLSGFSEALRSLQSNIEMTSFGKPTKIIQITSAAPGEGKTTVARCLAASAAAADLRVVYVDFDLRAALGSKSHDSEKSVGLIDVFSGNASLVDALRFDPKTRMHVLPVGIPASRGAVPFLKAAQLRNLLEGLRAEFDYIVIDSPPLGSVSDAAILAHMADKIVLVVKWNATPREIVQNAVRQLFDNYERVGVVLNAIDQWQAPKYDRHAYAQFTSKFCQYKTDCAIPLLDRSPVPLLSLPASFDAKFGPNDVSNRSASADTLKPAQTGEAESGPPAVPIHAPACQLK